MTKKQKISAGELLEIKNSIKRAEFRSSLCRFTNDKKLKRLLKPNKDRLNTSRILANYAASIFRAIASEQKSKTENSSLNESFKYIINEMAEKLDVDFFTQFGEELKAAPESLMPRKLEEFLISKWWPKPNSKWPPLCRMTPNGLFEICKWHLKQDHLTLESVVKTRQRLQLVPSTRQKIDAVRRGRKIFLSTAARRLDT